MSKALEKSKVLIESIKVIRGVGRFGQLGVPTPFTRVNLVYGENSRGKSTLAALLRSQAENSVDCLGIKLKPKHLAVLTFTGGAVAKLEDGQWVGTSIGARIFDDDFVERNVSSGYDVRFEHQTSLFQVILGEQGVELGTRYERLGEDSKHYQEEIKKITDKLNLVALTVGANLSDLKSVKGELPDSKDVESVQGLLSKQSQRIEILGKSLFESIPALPADIYEIEALCSLNIHDIERTAMAKVRSQAERVGPDALQWIGAGQQYLNAATACPFCGSYEPDKDLFAAYRGYFSESLKGHVAEIGARFDIAVRAFETWRKAVLTVLDRNLKSHGYWATNLPLKNELLHTGDFRSVCEGIEDDLNQLRVLKTQSENAIADIKDNSLLAKCLNEIREVERSALEATQIIREWNQQITDFKSELETNPDDTLAMKRKKHKIQLLANQPEQLDLLEELSRIELCKKQVDAERKTVKANLDNYQVEVLPRFERSVNDHLAKMGVEWKLDSVMAKSASRKTGTAYSILPDSETGAIAVGASSSGQGLGQLLSRGDRWSLALAFFLSTCNSTDLSKSLVIVDDPVTSLDDNRVRYTIECLVDLCSKSGQFVLLSHDVRFLKQFWNEVSNIDGRTCLRVIPSGGGRSDIEAWDILQYETEEYAAQVKMISSFTQNPTSCIAAEIPGAIRKILEHYLRLTQSAQVGATTTIGEFTRAERSRHTAGVGLISDTRLDELEKLNKFSRGFQHSGMGNAQIAEAKAYAQRTLDFLAG